MRNRRELYVEALKTLLQGRMSAVVKERDWDLLAEVARLASQDAPADLAVTDPALFRSWRAAVTRYHLRGWTNMTPERVARFRDRQPPASRNRNHTILLKTEEQPDTPPDR